MPPAAEQFVRIQITKTILATKCARCGVTIGYSPRLVLLQMVEKLHRCTTPASAPSRSVRLPRRTDSQVG